MKGNCNTLSSIAKSILNERGYTKTCYPLDYLAQTIEENHLSVKRKVWIYKWSGLFFLAFIPIISAILSILVGNKDLQEGDMVEYLTYSLTLLTVLNSIFKPSERFRKACFLGIKIQQFRSNFLTMIDKMPESEVTEDELLNLADKLSKEFQIYQEQLIDLFLPEAVVAPPIKPEPEVSPSIQKSGKQPKHP